MSKLNIKTIMRKTKRWDWGKEHYKEASNKNLLFRGAYADFMYSGVPTVYSEYERGLI